MIIKYRKLPTACTLFPGERGRRRHSSCFAVYWSRLGRTQPKGAYAYVTPLSILDRKISFSFFIRFSQKRRNHRAPTHKHRGEPGAAHRPRSVSLFASSAFRFEMCEFFPRFSCMSSGACGCVRAIYCTSALQSIFEPVFRAAM